MKDNDELKQTPEEQVVEEAVQEEAVKEDAVQEEVVQEEAVKEEAVKEEVVQEEAVQEEAVQEEAVQEEAVQEEAVQEEVVQEEVVKEEVVQVEVVEQVVDLVTNPEKTKIPLAGSKWSKWRLVHDVEALSDCQPLTCPYTPEYLQRFLDRFETVFLKPDEGYGGTDVIRVKRDGETLQALQESELHTFANVDSFDAWLSDIRKERTFLVQQGIDLMPYKGRLVDLRTILQKTPSGRWRVTGMFAKAAKPGMAVTNVKAGGHPFRVDKYIRRLPFEHTEKKRIERKLLSLSVAVANLFEQHYANTLYGLDIGIDRTGKLWLIEVNTKPSVLILRQIDMKMFRRAARLRWPQKFRRR